MSLQTQNILHIPVSVIDRSELLEQIESFAASGRVALVNNVNVHACNLAYSRPEFREVLNGSEIVFCDGFGVKLGAWLLGKKLGTRMTPPDWVDDLFSRCVAKGYSVFFIGDEDEVVERFAQMAVARHPKLDVAGWRNGFFDLEDEGVMDEVAQAEADIVITGMGMPRQELWAWRAKDRVGKGVFIATGALFRWYTGVEKRAPRWLTDHGLEWLARLTASPKRHFSRYMIGLPLFFFRILKQRMGWGDKRG